MHVEAGVETSRDAGSIPAASILLRSGLVPELRRTKSCR
jgi:hypothetical protein